MPPLEGKLWEGHDCAVFFTFILSPDFPGKNTGVCSHSFLQGIFPTQGLNSRLLHLLYRQMDSLPLRHLGSQTLPSLVGKQNGPACANWEEKKPEGRTELKPHFSEEHRHRMKEGTPELKVLLIFVHKILPFWLHHLPAFILLLVYLRWAIDRVINLKQEESWSIKSVWWFHWFLSIDNEIYSQLLNTLC